MAAPKEDMQGFKAALKAQQENQTAKSVSFVEGDVEEEKAKEAGVEGEAADELSPEELKIVEENPEMKWKLWKLDPETKRPINPESGEVMRKKSYKKAQKTWSRLMKGKSIQPKAAKKAALKKKQEQIADQVSADVIKSWHTVHPDLMERQPTMNVMTMGHVAHGKSTLMKAMSGESTQRSSSELKANMTIKLGYASAKIYKCPKCPRPRCFHYHKSTESKPNCKYADQCGYEGHLDLLRHYSFVDCPGHHSYMGTMLSAPSVVDGAILVVAANTPCPAPQTAEHMSAAHMLGMSDKVIVAQNKVDLVNLQRAVENSYEIESFVRNYTEDRPRIVPICAQMECNIDAFCESLVKYIPVPERDMTAPLRMICIRSFDVNKPGTTWETLQGGVLGGTIMQGTLKVGMDVEIRPGFVVRNGGTLQAIPIHTKVISIQNGSTSLGIAAPGGNVGVQTTIDPSLTKDNLMVGALVGVPDTLPPVFNEALISYRLMNKAMRNMHATKDAGDGKKRSTKVKMKVGEKLLLNIGSHSCQGEVVAMDVNAKFEDGRVLKSGGIFGPTCRVKLSYPACAACGTMVAVSMKLGDSWRLVGRAMLEGVKPLPIRKPQVARDAEAVLAPDQTKLGEEDEKKEKEGSDTDGDDNDEDAAEADEPTDV